MRYIFNDCVLDTERHELRRTGELVRLRPKVFQLLAYLIANRDRVISKQELFDQLWPKRVVGDATLGSCIMALRRAVGDRGASQHTVKTLHGQGHRFVARVQEQPHQSSGAEPERDSGELLIEGTSNESVTPPASDEPREPLVERSLRHEPPQPSPAVSAGKEHKQVTVLACALANAKAHASRLGPEAMDQLMQEFFILAKSVIERYQGTVTEWLGDGFTALFGAPVALEDHARRAVLAALELQQLIGKHQAIHQRPEAEPISICAGLHTGSVVVGRLDTNPDQIYTAVGDTTQIVTQIRDLANPSTLLISESTYRLVHTEVRAERRAASDSEGAPTVLPVYMVKAILERRAGVPQRGERALSRFVGRERELAILHERLAHVEAGEGQVVSVSGEPGIGKSRLLYEFRRSLNGKPITYLGGHCLSYGSATPYLPVLELLRQVCGIADTDSQEGIIAKIRERLRGVGTTSEEAGHLLLDLLGVPVDKESLERLDPHVRRSRTFGYLRQLIAHGTQRQPCVLAVEDLHWIDATSEEWLAELVDRLAGAAVLLLVTYRPGYRPPWLARSSATQLALPRLTPKDSTTLVLSVPRTSKLPDRLAHNVAVKANGNPFFLEELAWTIGADMSDGTVPRIPDTVQAVLAARIDQLSGGDKQLLQSAAVIGTQVPLSLLEAVSNLSEEELRGALGRLQASEFLYEHLAVTERSCTFKHALTQEVAYQSLLMSTRQQLHRKIAETLEQQFPDVVSHQPELLAHHYTEAGLIDQALGYWQQAGQRAIERSANSEAIAHLSRGLDLLETLPQSPKRAEKELGLQISLGVPLQVIKGPGSEDASQTYARARELCSQIGDRRRLFPALWGLWRASRARAQMQTARKLADELLALAQDEQEPALLLQAHHARWTTLSALGDFASALKHTEQGIALYSRQEHATQAFVIAGHDPCACGHNTAARTLWALGFPDQALMRSKKALVVARELNHPHTLALALDGAAELHQLRREERAFREQAENLFTVAGEHAFTVYLARATIMRGWILTAQGQGEGNISQMHQTLRSMQKMVSEAPYCAGLVAEAYATTGQPERGLTLLREVLIETGNGGEQYWDAELHRLEGELLLVASGENRSKAETCFHKAIDIARRQQAKSLELRAATSLSRLWRDQGKRQEAHDLLAPIISWFTEGFDTADLKEAKALTEEQS